MKLFKFKDNISIRKKLLNTYLISMGIATIITFLAMFAISELGVRKRLYEGDLRTTKAFLSNINVKAEEIKNITSDIVLSNELQNTLNINDEDVRGINIYSYLNQIISNFSEISSIYIIDNNESVYYVDSQPYYGINYELLKANSDIKNIKSKNGGAYFHILNKEFIGDENTTLAVSREIISKDNFKSLGYLIIFIKSSSIKKIFKDFFKDIPVSYVLVDENNKEIVLSEDNIINEYGKSFSQLNYNEKDYKRYKINNSKKLLFKTDFNLVNGSIITITDYKFTNDYLILLLVLIVILNVTFFIFSREFLDKEIIKPLDHIATVTKKINFGKNITNKFDIKGGYLELEYIVIAFNEMMARIQKQIEEIQNKQKIESKLKLEMLSSQIKPHFLYNTLSIASCLIKINEYDKADTLIDSLSRYYRESLSSGNDIITLGEEISIVYDYIRILEIGNSVLFSIKYNIDNKAINYRIPKLTIQTLIENCIKHGIKDMDIPINIELLVKINNENQCIIQVKDDGVGIEKERLNKICNREIIKGTSGFGMRSVIDRLSLYYDFEESFQFFNIESEENLGTTITIKLLNK